MFNRILVVCIGNICRSPTAERLLRQRLPEHTVDSAGLSALVGNPADAAANTVAAQHQLSLAGHQARQLDVEICQQYDLILVMEQGHVDMVCQLLPAARSKTMLFGQWLPHGQKEIADPYRQSTEMFLHVYQQMAKAADLWSEKLKHNLS
ncbi:low molecular weight protein-tyrosine-phosphatase [Paralysiella testudinis]|uniref:protein-tyrosine-phosphatase n=1 Tax=Paralysiella testudinis TaxID=2809020 RepID=A0A892ZKX4_9NEIS|nr:low molecular weight protein-tyrosine-phosphatase [Paralysiella testudinis]QRQ82447.1 low molecular weight phosphotyrosine protein phosphatase [Paralysiella testudinis]